MNVLNMLNVKKKKIFISHDKDDQDFKDILVQLLSETGKYLINSSDDNLGNILANTPHREITQHIRKNIIEEDAEVMVVLIGKESHSSAYIDWEIAASLIETDTKLQMGLLGIILPTHPDFQRKKTVASLYPPRIIANVIKGYAKMYDWTRERRMIHNWINGVRRVRFSKFSDNHEPLMEL